jgi:hypothetical protein
LLKEVPQVKLVKVDVSTMTLEFLSSFLVDNYKTSKISDLIEFRVERMEYKASGNCIF